MATSNSITENYDIFLSYEPQSVDKINKLYDFLVYGCSTRVFMDIKDQDTTVGQDLYSRLTQVIENSKLIICCISKEYSKHAKSKYEITCAYNSQKPLLIILLDRLTQSEFGDIYYAIERVKKNFILDDQKIIKNWNTFITEKLFLQRIEFQLGRKLHYNKTSLALKKRNDFKLKLKGIAGTNEEPKAVEIKIPFVSKAEISRRRSIFKIDDVLEYEDRHIIHSVEVQPEAHLGLRKFKSNPFLGSVYGFNRICYFPLKNRYLITSSHSGLLLSIDNNGNWIEKKNPGGLLKKPSSLCITRRHEILVGDSEAGCIFMFNHELKYIKSFGHQLVDVYFDMALDEAGDKRYDLYISDMYEGLIVIFDMNKFEARRRINVTSPAFIRICQEELYVLTSSDLLLVVNKHTLECINSIQLKNTIYMSGLHIDNYLNMITTSHSIDNNDNDESNNDENNKNKSKEVYLNITNVKSKETLRFYLGDVQYNDICIKDQRITCISDINVESFNFEPHLANRHVSCLYETTSTDDSTCVSDIT